MITFLEDYWHYIWSYLNGMDFVTWVLAFWPCIFLDLPRYVITDVLVLFDAAWRRLLRGPEEDDFSFTPPVTVIVPAYNEEEGVTRTVDSLLETHYPNMEIVVVDDGSEDETRQVCQRYVNKRQVKLVRQKRRGGKSSCGNLALNVASHDLIIVVDSDTSFDRDAIHRLVQPFRDPQVGAVSGNLRVRNWDENFWTIMQAFEYVLGISVGRRWLAMVDMLNIVSGAFGCFRREVLDDAGGWDVGPGEDADLTIKARKLGFKVAFANLSVAMTNVPNTARKLIKQRLRWNRTFIRLRLRKHLNVMNPFQFNFTNLIIQSVNTFYMIVLSLIFFIYLAYMSIFQPWLLPLIMGMTMISYTVFNLFQLAIAIVLSERKLQDLKLLPYTPLVTWYRLFVRCVRTWAYIEEWFRLPYTETYVPTEVQKAAPIW